MTSNSPTCVLSGGLCLQGAPQVPHQRVPTISSEVENSTFYCERCLYLQDPSSGSPGSAPGQCCPVTGGVLPAIMTTQDATDEDHLLDAHQHHHQPAHSSSCATPPPQQQHHHSTSNPSTPTCKSSKSGKSSGWKTSKFFSKTMSSGEILRGLKKLSLSGSSAAEPEGESPPSRPRKSKSGQLKKRSSYGNDEVATVDVEALAFGATQRSVVAAAVPVLNKAMSLVESGGPRPSNPGIVCKKEDLKAILCSATSSLVSKKFASSPGRRAARAPLRQTKSASFEPPAPKTKDPIRRTGSEEARSRTRPWVVEHHNEDANRTEEHGPDDSARLPDQPAPEAAALLAVESLNARNRTLTEAAGGGVGPSPGLQRPAGGSEGCLSAVKWDECEVVDAVLIGDAIETFLKVSMSGPEKRVSFRRNSLDKKAKSDG